VKLVQANPAFAISVDFAAEEAQNRMAANLVLARQLPLREDDENVGDHTPASVVGSAEEYPASEEWQDQDEDWHDSDWEASDWQSGEWPYRMVSRHVDQWPHIL
jgi:hypothetical protein